MQAADNWVRCRFVGLEGKLNVAFRVDASEKIGTGHLMRCLALANALQQRGVRTCFFSRHMPDNLLHLIIQQGHVFQRLSALDDGAPCGERLHSSWLEVSQETDARECVGALYGKHWNWLVVDHYALDARWEGALRQIVHKILVIDDLADRQHDCDLLLDQNLYLDMSARYVGRVPERCQLLLGPRFALLRDEFRQLRESVAPRQGAVKRVMVFFGGVDAHNFTGKALDALVSMEATKGLHVDVVLGAQHAFRETIEALCLRQGYYCHVQTGRMAELMAASDLALGAGGTTTWERCCLGLPTIAVSTADNQSVQLADAATNGLVYSPNFSGDVREAFVQHLGALLENDALRQLVSSLGMIAVDGGGVQRLVARMGCTGVEVRVALPTDSEHLHRWRNHPSIRAVSRNTGLIAWEDHCRWLNVVLEDPRRKLLIGLREGESVGVVRFDIEADQAEVSIYLVPEARVTCRGAELLQMAEKWLVVNCPEVRVLRAHVMGANKRSNGLFMAAGYDVDNTLFSKKLHEL